MNPLIVPVLTALAALGVRGIAIAELYAQLWWQERQQHARRSYVIALACALPPDSCLDEVQAAQADLPPMLPAIACYRFLLDGPQHWRRPDDSNRIGQPDYADACAWLPPALRAQAEELLASGEKIAQEHLGLQRLLSEPSMIMELAS